MDDREVASKPEIDVLDGSSPTAAELDSSAQQDTNRTKTDPNSNEDPIPYLTSMDTLSITPESVLIAKATQMRLKLFNSTTLCTSAASTCTTSTFPTPSPSHTPSLPITLEYAKMALDQEFKVSRCRILQALKLTARMKCTRYNAAVATNEALLYDISNLTVDDLAAALRAHRASQREQLLDLFGFVEPADADADEAMRLRAPAVDPPFGVFIGSTSA